MEGETQDKLVHHHLQIGNQKQLCSYRKYPHVRWVGENMSGFQQAGFSPQLFQLQPCSQSCSGKPLCPQSHAGKSSSPGRTQSAHLGLSLLTVQQL